MSMKCTPVSCTNSRGISRKIDDESERNRLKEVVASSYRCTLLWKKVLRLAAHRPSPITFFDGTIHMGPAVVLRGDERAERYYEVLVADDQQGRVVARHQIGTARREVI